MFLLVRQLKWCHDDSMVSWRHDDNDISWYHSYGIMVSFSWYHGVNMLFSQFDETCRLRYMIDLQSRQPSTLIRYKLV